MSQTAVTAPPEPTPSASAAPRTRPRRPFGLRAILALLTLLTIGDVLSFGEDAITHWHEVNGRLLNLLTERHIEDTLGLALLGVEIVIEVVTVFGLWRFRRWAWLLLMFYLGSRMGFGLWQYFEGNPNYGAMVINVVTALYLNQRDVQRVFTTSAEEQA